MNPRIPGSVFKDVGLKAYHNLGKRKIVIYATACAAVTPVMGAIDQAWLSGLGLKKTWFKGAAVADAVNVALAEGAPLQSLFPDTQRRLSGIGSTCTSCGYSSASHEIELDASTRLPRCVRCRIHDLGAKGMKCGGGLAVPGSAA